jgi:predicted O-methyltransferase YrrM
LPSSNKDYNKKYVENLEVTFRMEYKTKIRELLERMQNEDAEQREQALEKEERWRSISRDTGECLSIITRLSKAKNIVEIGTSQGFSTIWLGLAAKCIDAHVSSFEIAKWRYEQAEMNIAEAELGKYVTLIHGDIKEKISSVPSEIDLLFLDAEKSDYLDQFKFLFDRIKEGGIIIADNAVSHFSELRSFIEYVRNHDQCNSFLLPIGRGLELTYKITQGENILAPWQELIR